MFLVLASASPRRRELLNKIGIKFQINVSNVDERVTEIDPESKVLAIAKKKGLDVFSKYNTPDVVILSADTIVVVDNEVLGKPKDKDDARRMISLLQGRKHFVYTGVYIQSVFKFNGFVEKTEVEVASMSADEIEEYISTTEPYDKAGSYGIQGKFAKYIKSINGDYFNVMGLPVNHVYEALKDFDFKQVRRCKTCYNVLNDDEEICKVCGTKQEIEQIICSNCKALNNSKNKFCVKCGKELDDSFLYNKNVCPICHHMNEGNSNFCESCGARMHQDEKASKFIKEVNKKDLTQMSQVSFIFGIVALVTSLMCTLSPIGFVASIVSFVLGIKSKNYGNEKKSTMGIIFSIFAFTISIISIVFICIAMLRTGQTY